MRGLKTLAFILLIIGGINWGLVALFQYDLVAEVFGQHFGEVSTLSRIVYGLVGLSALYELFTFRAIHGHEETDRHRRGVLHS